MITTVLNVVLGISFTWLLLSLASMFLVEGLVSRWQWRPRMLEEAIQTMLGSTALTEQLYSHPLIRSLYSGSGGTRKPSYIPARQFALALLDMIGSVWTDAALLQQQLTALRGAVARLPRRQRALAWQQLQTLLSGVRKTLAANSLNGLNNYPVDPLLEGLENMARQFPTLADEIRGAVQRMQRKSAQVEQIAQSLRRELDGAPTPYDRLRLGIASLAVTNPRLKQTLTSLLPVGWSSDEDIETFQENLMAWYNNSMDRLNGAYKRRTYTLALLVSFMLALLGNVDMISLAQRLWREPQVRQALAVQAEVWVAEHGSPEMAPDALALEWQRQMGLEGLPFGWLGAPDPNCAAVDGRVMRLAGVCYPLENVPATHDAAGWGLKLLGLVLAALGAGQGAPFWFDVLKKIVNVRLSGPAPADGVTAAG